MHQHVFMYAWQRVGTFGCLSGSGYSHMMVCWHGHACGYVGMCVRVLVRVCTCKGVCAPRPSNICINVCTSTCALMLHVCARTSTCACMHACTFQRTRACTCKCRCARTYTRVRAYSCIHLEIHTFVDSQCMHLQIRAYALTHR